MGIFSGIGGAYTSMGLANALQQAPYIAQADQDRKRKQAREDEELAAWRADRSSAAAQRQIENARLAAADARAATSADDVHTEHAHQASRYGVEDTQHDEAFGMNKRLTQGKIDQIPLEQQELRTRISAQNMGMSEAGLRMANERLALQDKQLDQQHKKAMRDAQDTAEQADTANDPSVWQDWFRTHMPSNQDVNIVKSPKGGWDVQHYHLDQSNDGPPKSTLVNTKHMDSLDDFREEADKMTDPDFYKRLQAAGMARPNFTALYGEGNIPVILNHRTGAMTTQDGKPFTGRLQPKQEPILGMGGAAAQPGAGAQFIQQALGAQQQQQGAQPQQGGVDLSKLQADYGY